MEKHFCVSVYVFNETGKFLLIKHKKLGRWLQPGGHIDINEDPEDAAIREVFEETGFHVELLGKRFPRNNDYIQPLALQKNIIKDNHIHVDFVYAARIIDGVQTMNQEETDGIKWFTVEKINNVDFETFPDVKEWVKIIQSEFMTTSLTKKI